MDCLDDFKRLRFAADHSFAYGPNAQDCWIRILIGDRDGRRFDQVAESEQKLHPCLSRDRMRLVADRISYLGVNAREGVALIERATGKQKLIAATGSCKTGADHQHPSFNRGGDRVLFSNPDANGIAQVCTMDLKQVMKDW